jgi:hypothetical protein
MPDLKSETRLQDIAALCARYRVNRLSVFGSAVDGTYQDGSSDVDLLVEFKPMPPVEHASCYFGLIESLESLLGAPVDLVEDKAISNPFFRAAVERSKQPVFAADA